MATDIPNSKGYRIGGDGKVIEFIADTKRANGQAFGPDGRLYIDLDCKNNPTEINQSLIKFLAQILEVNPAQIEIVAGANADKKLVSILDIDSERTQAQILSYLQQK